MRYTGGDSNNKLLVKMSNVEAFDGSNTHKAKKLGSTISYYTSSDLAMTIIGGT